jgi:hypothetical protein
VILKVSVTDDEVLNTKLWLVPNAGLSGQVTFNGLQSVHVCESAPGARNATPTRSDKSCMAEKECRRSGKQLEGVTSVQDAIDVRRECTVQERTW